MTRRFQRIDQPLQVATTGEAIGTGIGILAGVIVLVIVGFVMALLFSVQTKAHDSGKGWSYPWECCHDQDCAEISADRVKPTPGGYIVDGRFTVAQKDVKDSPDGRYHACFPKPDFLRCLFVPPPGS